MRVSAAAVPGGIELVVEDEGPGVADHLRTRLSDAAESPPSPDSAELGLQIVGRFAALHGGRVDVESGPHGRGARFRVWLPARTDET